MHIQIINYNLKDITVEEYERTCYQLALSFANTEGLIKKYWIKNSSENIYGGIYVWADKTYMEAFAQSELFKTVVTHPNFDNIKYTDFGVIEHPTGVTRGLIVEDYVNSKSS